VTDPIDPAPAPSDVAAPPRPRSRATTRAAILTAARRGFARDGFERATVRSIASAAGVDPALVMRYFGSKAGLFAEAAELVLELPDLSALQPDEVARALVRRFFAVWEEDDTFLVLLRASATSPVAADRLRRVFLEQVLPVLSAAAVDHPAERAAVVGSQVIGFAYARYVLENPVLRAMDEAAVQRWLGSGLVHQLLGEG
jgi:AcrR family transcriptional regulator